MTICYPALDLYMDFGAGLVSIASDTFITRAPISANWGNTACDPLTRVAYPGNINFLLNNSEYNSNSHIGYYSPGHASARVGFGLETPVVLKVGYGGVYKYKRFYISSINPVPGVYGDRQTEIVATDIMGRLVNQNVTGLSVQVSKRIDQGLSTLVALLPTAPLATAYSVAPELQTYLFTDVTADTPFLTAIQHLALTDAGYIFSKANASGGESLCYETRQERQLRTSGLTLSGTMTDLSIPISENQILNDITTTVYPGSVGAADEILYTTPQELLLPAGATKIIEAGYTEPGAGSVGSYTTVVLKPGTEVTPVANTDYKASLAPGSLSGDANALLSITVTWYANYAKIVLLNLSATFDLYIMPMNLRGRIIRLYNSINSRVQDTVPNYQKYGVRPLSYPMHYQSNINFANDMANHWFSVWHLPAALPQFIEFIANWDTTLMAAAVSLDIGSRFTVVETVTGITADFCIMGIDITIKDGSLLTVRYYTEPVSLAPACILNDAVYGVLDSVNCRIGF